MHYDPSNYPILDADELRSLPAVAEFCQDLPLICDEDISRHCWEETGPVVLRTFHGTTHEFEQFDVERSKHQNFLGKAIYFTSSHWDCVQHYATVNGPDLKVHLDIAYERLVDEISDDPEGFGCPEGCQESFQEKARELARAKLVGTCERVIETLVRIEKPLVISADPHSQDIPLFPDLEDRCEESRLEVCSDHNVAPDDWESQEEIEDEIFEAKMRVEERDYDRLQMAFCLTLGELLEDGVLAPQGLNFDEPLSEMTTQSFWNLIRNDVALLDLSDECGNSIRDTLFTRMAAHLGFDSIILLHADQQFKMDMDLETSHIHLPANRWGQTLQINKDLRQTGALEAA